MALTDNKILNSERNAAYVKSNPGRRLTGTVDQNKDAFDKFPQLIMDKYNALVDLLTAFGLDTIAEDIASRYTKAETDTKITEETNDLIETIEFTKEDGKFKITTKSGAVSTIDTDLEKIPASFELMEESGKTVLRITNQDGTYTQTDVTSLLNVYTFTDSDTIDFTESPTYSITAIVKPNSITLDHLSLAAVSTLEGYVASAASSAAAAEGSATSAETSANNASTFERSAKGYSESASASAAEASRDATNAGNAATAANQRANASDTSAILSQSYARGGTGTRTGEDVDNARYYMEQAKAIVGGDFATKTELEDGLKTKVDKVEGKGLSTNDYTTAEKDKVANLPDDTTTELSKKVEKLSGKGLSTNDYTTTEKNKLSGITSGATKNTVVTYIVSVDASWTSATGYVQKTVTVNGILSTDNPIIDLITTTADFEAQQEAWGKVFKVTTATNSITLYASEATTKEINLQLKVVR